MEETFQDELSEAKFPQTHLFPYAGGISPGQQSSLPPPVQEETLGFDDEGEEVIKLIDRLTGTQTELEVISILATTGTGAVSCSILAGKVFHHPFVVSHFHIRGWTYFSAVHGKRGLLLGILSHLIEITSDVFKMNNDKLGQKLNKLLLMGGPRFLIVIDTMWDFRAWYDLERYFPDNKNGSKIVFTNSPQSVAFSPQFYSQPPHLEKETGETCGGVEDLNPCTPGQASIVSSSCCVKEEIIVGFEDEVMKLVDQLTGLQKKRLEVISIVGMPGLGKTTLARKIYNHPSVVYHFYIRAWTRVSQAYQRRDLLLGILSSVTEVTDEIYEMSDGKLLELLRKRLLGHRYLIVMDDMWDNGAWDDLKRSFPNDNNGSKIMFTSRLADVSLHAQPNSHPFYLRFLTQKESWELLRQKVFQIKRCPRQLMEIGLQIAKKCEGLPLAIVVIAGILANEKTLTWWRQVANSVSSYIVSNPEQYMDTLALSYNHLPQHLKACFLYLGAFLEEREVPVRKLIWLWLAEGFIHPSGSKRLEDVAEDYLMELINRSLLIVSKKGSNGGIKSCIIHDLMRELCLRKVEEENFMQQLYKFDENSPPSSPFTGKPGRLCIYSANFPHSSLMHFAPHARSLLCFAVDILPDFTSFICQAFKLLRVLDLSSIKIPLFPSEVVQLVDLRYFALQAEVGSPPPSISNLRYLETLIVSSKSNVTLPKNLWKMVNIRHLCIKLGVNEIEDPTEEVQGNGGYPLILGNLQTLSFVCPSQSCQDVLARAPRLRKLGFSGPLISESRDLRFPNLDFSNHLETLKLFNTAFYREPSSSCNPIMFPERLKRLTLTNTALAWSEMWTLGMLPNLEVLKLKLHACVGRQWETSDGGFRRLKFLKFQDLDVVQWIASSYHFPCLQQLVLHGCRNLEKIPSSLGNIPTLEIVEVLWCSNTAASSARKIKKDQESKGNDWVKIITREQRR